jgi:protein-tyrosine phosphatase
MRRIGELSLFIGHAGDLRDLRAIHAAEIAAVVDLAANEPPAALTRDLAYCRLPLIDGPGNPGWLLWTAVTLVTDFVRESVPSLVCCSGGMSRSPAVAAAAIARVQSITLHAALELVAAGGAIDVSPGLWHDVEGIIERR